MIYKYEFSSPSIRLLEQIIEQQMEFLEAFGDEPLYVCMNQETQHILSSDVLMQVSGMEVYTDNRLPSGVTSVTDERPL